MDQLTNIFTNPETPFAVLFIALFAYYIRDSRQREERQAQKYDLLQQSIEKQIQDVQNDIKIMLSVWKILIDKELERRKE